MESWTLQHPELGRIEIRTGFDNEFLAEDPSWPEQLPERFAKDPDAITPVPAYGPPWQRVRALKNKPPTRVEVRVNGEVQNRYSDLDSGRIPLFGTGPGETLPPMMHIGIDRAKPHLKLVVSPFKELLQVEFREGDRVVEFDPPEGTRGEKRRNAMQSSSFKRTVIPMLEGLGKGAWAVIVLVLAPVISRFFDWLGQYLPDWQMPDITLPHLDLPVPNLPQLDLPTPNWPGLNLPDLPEMPMWVEWLVEYSKIWVPVVLGIVVGILALRNHRKSEAEKARWEAERDEAQRDAAATDEAAAEPGTTVNRPS